MIRRWLLTLVVSGVFALAGCGEEKPATKPKDDGKKPVVKVETPKVETPKVETPKVETPKVEKAEPKVEKTEK
jgi:hypothetical protein